MTDSTAEIRELRYLEAAEQMLAAYPEGAEDAPGDAEKVVSVLTRPPGPAGSPACLMDDKPALPLTLAALRDYNREASARSRMPYPAQSNAREAAMMKIRHAFHADSEGEYPLALCEKLKIADIHSLLMSRTYIKRKGPLAGRRVPRPLPLILQMRPADAGCLMGDRPALPLTRTALRDYFREARARSRMPRPARSNAKEAAMMKIRHAFHSESEGEYPLALCEKLKIADILSLLATRTYIKRKGPLAGRRVPRPLPLILQMRPADAGSIR